MKKGKVYLVGAGPGDPGLLTLRGQECLELADVVVADYLANAILLEYCSPEAECIRLGRRGTSGYLSQSLISTLLVEKAKAGKQVVRLKNGDPFVFGRGGEEAEALAAHGIEFDVVPGVSAAVACPAYAGIPITHRRYASEVTIVTGHEDPILGESNIDWKNLARSHGTLVVMMGLHTLPSIFDSLLGHGMPPETPVAVISQGTLPQQRVLVESLENIGKCMEQVELGLPVMAVIGEVVNLEKHLRWFDEESVACPTSTNQEENVQAVSS